jgi:hypothetical protein
MTGLARSYPPGSLLRSLLAPSNFKESSGDRGAHDGIIMDMVVCR